MVLWITVLILLSYLLLISYYTWHWHRIKTFVPTTPSPTIFVSVVVAARNESTNIAPLLQSLAQQDFPPHQYEVIIVDDFSTDDTAAIAKPFLNDQVKLIQPKVAAALSSKKKAIEAGVAAASGTLIAVTDADCIPPSTWLSSLASLYAQKEAAFIVAPVQLIAKNNVLGLFQSLDFAMLQGITASGVQARAHSMCNGANLAYTKSAFEKANGFEGIDGRASGDDMLLLHKIWKHYPDGVHYLKSKGAIVPTPAMQTWKDFIAQRIRWSSKATYYQDKRITATLFFVYFFNVWAMVLSGIALLQVNYWWLALLFFVSKTIIELMLLRPVAYFFNLQKKLWAFPLLQPLHVVYTVSIGILSRRPHYQWKGRRTK